MIYARGVKDLLCNPRYRQPGAVSKQMLCRPITAGFEGNAHPQLRRLAGAALEKEGWPLHLMLGWPEGGGTKFAYAFPKQRNQSASPSPFTEWAEAVEVDIGGWMDPTIFAGGAIMYPSLLDADSPFTLGPGTADGLSFALVGNESAHIYFVSRRTLLARVPVAFVPWYTQPQPEPFPPPPPAKLNEANCKSFRVAGAGDAKVDGVYSLARNASGQPPSYSLDTTHQLYFFGGHWKMAHEGVGPVYYTASDTHGGAERVPVTSWAGAPPFPTVTCIDAHAPSSMGRLKLDDDGSVKLLFIDDAILTNYSSDFRFTINRPVKAAAPAITADKPWESCKPPRLAGLLTLSLSTLSLQLMDSGPGRGA